jgi:hypothetical protein
VEFAQTGHERVRLARLVYSRTDGFEAIDRCYIDCELDRLW